MTSATPRFFPGLVDSHVHINEPGRTEWEGFETATRAAAAGGYTMLVDMPLNCLPATTTVAALEAKREAARGKCRVDWAAWGGVVRDNQGDIESLAAAGVRGFKCFLVHPGIDGFTMVTEQELRDGAAPCCADGPAAAGPRGTCRPDRRGDRQLAGADWRSYATYLQSRPDEAELSAIRLLLVFMPGISASVCTSCIWRRIARSTNCELRAPRDFPSASKPALTICI